MFQITQERDDEGFGGNTDSQINGNARTPLACCTVGRTRSRNWYNPLSAMDIQNMGMFHFNALSCLILYNNTLLISSYLRISVISLYLQTERYGVWVLVSLLLGSQLTWICLNTAFILFIS